MTFGCAFRTALATQGRVYAIALVAGIVYTAAVHSAQVNEENSLRSVMFRTALNAHVSVMPCTLLAAKIEQVSKR